MFQKQILANQRKSVSDVFYPSVSIFEAILWKFSWNYNANTNATANASPNANASANANANANTNTLTFWKYKSWIRSRLQCKAAEDEHHKLNGLILSLFVCFSFVCHKKTNSEQIKTNMKLIIELTNIIQVSSSSLLWKLVSCDSLYDFSSISYWSLKIADDISGKSLLLCPCFCLNFGFQPNYLK